MTYDMRILTHITTHTTGTIAHGLTCNLDCNPKGTSECSVVKGKNTCICKRAYKGKLCNTKDSERQSETS